MHFYIIVPKPEAFAKLKGKPALKIWGSPKDDTAALKAIAASGSEELGRKSVWENLSYVMIQDRNSAGLVFKNGQLFPNSIYIYQGTNIVADWFIKPFYVAHP